MVRAKGGEGEAVLLLLFLFIVPGPQGVHYRTLACMAVVIAAAKLVPAQHLQHSCPLGVPDSGVLRSPELA